MGLGKVIRKDEIVHTHSTVYTLEENGLKEEYNRTHPNKMKAFLRSE